MSHLCSILPGAFTQGKMPGRPDPTIVYHLSSAVFPSSLARATGPPHCSPNTQDAILPQGLCICWDCCLPCLSISSRRMPPTPPVSVFSWIVQSAPLGVDCRMVLSQDFCGSLWEKQPHILFTLYPSPDRENSHLTPPSGLTAPGGTA